jgi:glutathione synthase/RimK-type ligase-like ATP-grasp enzyme
MRIGIFGTDDDPQVHAVAKEVRALGADDVLIRSDALDEGLPLSELDGTFLYRGANLSDLRGFYLRTIPAPYAPHFEREDGELVLYEDWFIRYMHERERASYFVAWLLALQDRGARLINPPHAGSVLQYKPFQLNALRSIGAPVPRTLISNDPDAVRAFEREVGDVIFKPLMGGAITRRLSDLERADELDAVRNSPVIFQQCIAGDDLRVMLAGDAIVSSVAIRTPEQHLDFRDDPVYASGDARYEPVELPSEIAQHCRAAARKCGLRFAGLDLKRTPDGRFVFLELNSSPIYLDVELKLGHPISRAIAELVVGTR